MQFLPFALLALACPIGMGLMMLFMGKGMMSMGHGKDHPEGASPVGPGPADSDKKLAILQAQRQLLDAQIASMQEAEHETAARDEPVR